MCDLCDPEEISRYELEEVQTRAWNAENAVEDLTAHADRMALAIETYNKIQSYYDVDNIAAFTEMLDAVTEYRHYRK